MIQIAGGIVLAIVALMLLPIVGALALGAIVWAWIALMACFLPIAIPVMALRDAYRAWRVRKAHPDDDADGQAW